MGTIYFLYPSFQKSIDVVNIENIAPTGISDPDTNVKKEQTLVIFSWSLEVATLSEDFYPKINIKAPIKQWTIYYTIEITDNLKESWYLKSDSYNFAFRFFLWSFENWGYYKVFRKINNGVGNDLNLWLDWAIPWRKLNWWYIWEIPLSEKVPVAKSKWEYWYINLNTLNFINSNVWKKVSIWGYLSSVKEFPEWGWKTTKIRSIIISYEWEKWALEIVK